VRHRFSDGGCWRFARGATRENKSATFLLMINISLLLFTNMYRSLLTFLTLFAASAAAQTDSRWAAIDDFVEETRSTFSIPFGTAYAVVQGDRILHEGYFGFSDIDAGLRVDPETSFYIASATKPFFALAVLLQAEAGALEPGTELDTLFPGTAFPHLDPTTIT